MNHSFLARTDIASLKTGKTDKLMSKSTEKSASRTVKPEGAGRCNDGC
jgi:hypothetical protein